MKNKEAKAVCAMRTPKPKQSSVGTKCPHTNFDVDVDVDFRLYPPLFHHRVAEAGQEVSARTV